MTRVNRPLLAVVLFALASIAHADALHLVAPANGATLRGGSSAELRWSAAQLPANAEEWEAFLSIDGGKYYAFRVTPHLDIDLRRFTFVVPNVDTRNARILIRTGNEEHETHFESQFRFTIVRDSRAEEAVRVLRFERGEAARDGDPAVVAWADGARNGSGVTQQSGTTAPSRSFRRSVTVPGDGLSFVAPAAIRVATPHAQLERASCAIGRRAAHDFAPAGCPASSMIA